MQNINSPEQLKEQYGSSANLESRITAKRLFSTTKLGWADFLLQNFQLQPNQRVLELGCGSAVFWKHVAPKMPKGVRLTLSDASPGMIDTAKSNTNKLKFIEEYAVIDAQNIPYDENTFDIVIANYMLYHVPNVEQALREISRVLKPKGSFFAATYGKDNLKEVKDIFGGFDARIQPALNDLCDVFGLENGSAYLAKYFDCVQCKRYENSLHITELKPLVDYFLSYRGMGNISEMIPEGDIPRFADYIAEVFAKNGYVGITQDEGLFVASGCEC
ncbi:MAG: class I SAM-dependent methyltransferase [Oscillospiraceae bacterium]|nr:class I SAM-dependent methyltransferase [Oscillospiraceae bacterium]